FIEPDVIEATWRGTKKCKHLSFCQQRSQIDYTGKLVLPDNLDDAVDHRLDTLHRNYVSHLSSPASAVPQQQPRHLSIPSGVGMPMIARDSTSREAATPAKPSRS